MEVRNVACAAFVFVADDATAGPRRRRGKWSRSLRGAGRVRLRVRGGDRRRASEARRLARHSFSCACKVDRRNRPRFAGGEANRAQRSVGFMVRHVTPGSGSSHPPAAVSCRRVKVWSTESSESTRSLSGRRQQCASSRFNAKQFDARCAFALLTHPVAPD
jgi:hypothetical protein